MPVHGDLSTLKAFLAICADRTSRLSAIYYNVLWDKRRDSKKTLLPPRRAWRSQHDHHPLHRAAPCGAFVAHWDEDENVPPVFSGNSNAVEYFKAYMAATRPNGPDGRLLAFEALEPNELEGFCQSDEFGIIVWPYDATMPEPEE